jgi:hypothetical protein
MNLARITAKRAIIDAEDHYGRPYDYGDYYRSKSGLGGGVLRAALFCAAVSLLVVWWWVGAL